MPDIDVDTTALIIAHDILAFRSRVKPHIERLIHRAGEAGMTLKDASLVANAVNAFDLKTWCLEGRTVLRFDGRIFRAPTGNEIRIQAWRPCRFSGGFHCIYFGVGPLEEQVDRALAAAELELRDRMSPRSRQKPCPTSILYRLFK